MKKIIGIVILLFGYAFAQPKDVDVELLPELKVLFPLKNITIDELNENIYSDLLLLTEPDIFSSKNHIVEIVNSYYDFIRSSGQANDSFIFLGRNPFIRNLPSYRALINEINVSKVFDEESYFNVVRKHKELFIVDIENNKLILDKFDQFVQNSLYKEYPIYAYTIDNLNPLTHLYMARATYLMVDEQDYHRSLQVIDKLLSFYQGILNTENGLSYTQLRTMIYSIATINNYLNGMIEYAYYEGIELDLFSTVINRLSLDIRQSAYKSVMNLSKTRLIENYYSYRNGNEEFTSCAFEGTLLAKRILELEEKISTLSSPDRFDINTTLNLQYEIFNLIHLLEETTTEDTLFAYLETLLNNYKNKPFKSLSYGCAYSVVQKNLYSNKYGNLILNVLDLTNYQVMTTLHYQLRKEGNGLSIPEVLDIKWDQENGFLYQEKLSDFMGGKYIKVFIN